jgi:ADP-ribose pyrophosphatase
MLKPWSVSDSKITYQDRWLTVRSDTCVRSDGLVISPYHVIEAHTWVCIVALTPDNRVVLTSEYRHGAQCIGTGLPGGGVEPSDPDPKSAAIRELLEETGFSCDAWDEIGLAYANWANQNNKIVFFLGRGAIRAQGQSLDENEEIDIALLPWEHYLDSLTENAGQAFHVAAAFYAARFMTSEQQRSRRP